MNIELLFQRRAGLLLCEVTDLLFKSLVLALYLMYSLQVPPLLCQYYTPLLELPKSGSILIPMFFR